MAQEIITLDDLQNFKLQLVEEIKSILKPSIPDQKEWLKSADVRKMLGISSGTLQTLRINHELTYSKIGSIFYYRYDDIIKRLENNSISKSKME